MKALPSSLAVLNLIYQIQKRPCDEGKALVTRFDEGFALITRQTRIRSIQQCRRHDEPIRNSKDVRQPIIIIHGQQGIPATANISKCKTQYTSHK